MSVARTPTNAAKHVLTTCDESIKSVPGVVENQYQEQRKKKQYSEQNHLVENSILNEPPMVEVQIFLLSNQDEETQNLEWVKNYKARN